jgi:hypothetical protein
MSDAGSVPHTTTVPVGVVEVFELDEEKIPEKTAIATTNPIMKTIMRIV